MKYANDYAPAEERLSLTCLHHEADVVKADSYILRLGGYILLIDGGMTGSCVTRDYLLGLRRELLAAGGLGEDSDLPLRLDWLVSHFHVDHVAAVIEDIIPDRRFEFNNIVLPPDSGLDGFYSEHGPDGDKKYRPKLSCALSRRGFDGKIINIEFGEENITELRFCDRLSLTVYPPVYNYGVGERLDYMIDNYYGGERTHKMVATAVVNSSSLWLRVGYGEKSFLFTGDTMKRESHLDLESANLMYEAYHNKIGRVDILKYLHHGYRRDDAASLMLGFEPEYIIMSCKTAGGEDAIRKICPDTETKFVNCGFGDYIFETDGKKLELVKEIPYVPVTP